MVKKFITEIMEDVQADETRIKDYLQNTTLRSVFEYTYDPAKKWLLPAGTPPYRPAPEPMGMTPTNFLQTVRIWPNFQREDLKPLKREQIFINILEGVYDSEALLLVAIKDGTISKLYPFATLKFGITHGFLPKELEVSEAVSVEVMEEPESPKA